MNTYCLMRTAVFCFAMALIACGETSNTSGTDQLSDSELGEETGPFAGWEELHEPFGDESFARFRVVPNSYQSGDKVTLEVSAGSYYGPVGDATIAYRLTDGSEINENGWIANPDMGPAWIQLNPEGMYKIEDETDEVVKLEGFQPPREEMYGYMLYKTIIEVDGPNRKIELRLQQPGATYGGIKIEPRDWVFQANPVAWEQ